MTTPALVHVAVLALSMAAVGCVDGAGGAVGEPGVDAGLVPRDRGVIDMGPVSFDAMVPADAGDPTLTEVPSDLPLVATNPRCVPLDGEEAVWSTDPEGHLWLSRTSTTGQRLRVLDAWGGPPGVFSTLFQQVDGLFAESATAASVVADGQLWSFQDGARIAVRAPFSPTAEARVCGRLGDSAYVLDGTKLYQRDGDTWLEWTGLESALGLGSTALLDQDGACVAEADALFFRSGDLAVWTLQPQALTRTATLPGGQQVILRDGQLLATKDGLLYRDPGAWRRWRFADGEVTGIAAGGRYAWIVAGSALIRFDGATFARVDPALSSLPSHLYPFAGGGLWYRAGDQVCAVSPDRMIRVRGLQNGAVGIESAFSLQARTNDDATGVELSVRGQAVAPLREQNGWFSFTGPLDLGWTRLDLSTSPPSVTRPLWVRRSPMVSRSWMVDVQPIYAEHCSASACHVADSSASAPNLDTYAAWVARAGALERRLVQRQDMPPPASRRPTWGSNEVRIIQEWLVGGLRP